MRSGGLIKSLPVDELQLDEKTYDGVCIAKHQQFFGFLTVQNLIKNSLKLHI